MTSAGTVRPRGAAQVLRHWRDWPLVVKLVAMMLAPTVVIVALGAVLLSSQVHAARADATQAALVRLEVRAHSVATALGGGSSSSSLAAATRSFRAAAGASTPGVGPAPEPLPGRVQARLADAQAALSSLPANPDGAARSALLSLEQSAAAHVSDPEVARLARSLHRMDSRSTSGGASAAGATAKRLSTTARRLADSSSNRIGITAVLLFIAVLVCAALAAVVGRALVVSLGRLRRRTDDVAERELPAAVRRVRAGEEVSTEVTPIETRTGDEIAALARSFEAVQGQALALAAEQAGLRAEAGGVFVNLSRRSQSLVQRQLRLLERLERDEEDPEQLDTLFQLDHLATRMRRNNENLMVLSGGDPGRAGKGAMTVADVLRAAASEVEQYQRVHIAPPADGSVVGYAASDLVRMLAELLDNATSFSAPETTVALASEYTGQGGLAVDVLDEGVGMSESDLAAANAALATSEQGELPAARQMGLFVVGRLAARYGVTVGLSTRADAQGLRASLVLPSLLLDAAVQEAPAEAVGDAEPVGDETPVDDREPARFASPDESPTPLPTRQRGQAARQAGIPVTTSGPAEGGTESGEGGEPAPTEPAPSDVEATESIQGSWFLPVPRSEPEPSLDLFAPEASAPEPQGSDAPAVRAPKAAEEPFDVFAVPTQAPEAAPASAGGSEGTPIFDDMASAWFAGTTVDVAAAPDGEPAWSGFPTAEWSDADRGWQQADAAAHQAPATFTESGLPMRTPRARLVPGSMAAQDPQDPGAERDGLLENGQHRDPEEARERYTGLLRGLTEAGRGQAGEEAAQAPGGETDDLTTSGLPKRTRGARLLPREEADEERTMPRDSEQVRDRLASLQRGVSRGREDRAKQASAAEESASDEHAELG